MKSGGFRSNFINKAIRRGNICVSAMNSLAGGILFFKRRSCDLRSRLSHRPSSCSPSHNSFPNFTFLSTEPQPVQCATTNSVSFAIPNTAFTVLPRSRKSSRPSFMLCRPHQVRASPPHTSTNTYCPDASLYRNVMCRFFCGLQ
jgi:hypothetical protein